MAKKSTSTTARGSKPRAKTRATKTQGTKTAVKQTKAKVSSVSKAKSAPKPALKAPAKGGRK